VRRERALQALRLGPHAPDYAPRRKTDHFISAGLRAALRGPKIAHPWYGNPHGGRVGFPPGA